MQSELFEIYGSGLREDRRLRSRAQLFDSAQDALKESGY